MLFDIYTPDPVNNKGTLPVELTEKGLTLTDQHGVIMAWTMDELQSPHILAVAFNCANLYIEHDAPTVRASLGLTEDETTSSLEEL